MNIGNFDPNNIEIDKKFYKRYSYLLYWICDDKRFKIRKNLQPKFFVPFFKYMNGYFEEINGNRYLTLVPTNKSKEKKSKIWRTVGQNRTFNQVNNF